MSKPYQIVAMMQQIGTGFRGGFVYVGAGRPFYKCSQAHGGEDSQVLSNGIIVAPVTITFPVNGKRGQSWHIIVNLESNDTYNVYLWKPVKQSPEKTLKLLELNQTPIMGKILYFETDVYCDMLQECVETMYDSAIKKHNNGFIPM